MTFIQPTHPERFEGKYGSDQGGRLAERHPNSYPSNPSPFETWLKVQSAANWMATWRNASPDLPPEALEAITRAFELLHDIDYELPRVYGFVCRYKLVSFSAGCDHDHYSEFSAHESVTEALRWAMEWERKLPHGPEGDSSTGPWEIAWASARVRDFRAFGTDPKKFIRSL